MFTTYAAEGTAFVNQIGSEMSQESLEYLPVSIGMIILLIATAIIMWRLVSNSKNPSSEASQPNQNQDDPRLQTCPNCEEPTEAEYRFCRNCAADTGSSYMDGLGSGGSDESSIL